MKASTGLPVTDNYQLGRGTLYFAELDANSRPKGWRDLGNSPDFKLAIEVETLQHKSSRQGLKFTDKEVTISQTVTCQFALDEFNADNLALLFSGASTTHTNVAVAGFTEWLMVPDGELALGRWYDLKNASHARAYDIDATKLTVKTNEAAPVTLVKDTDFTLDATMGRIFILSSSTKAATAIGTGDGLLVTLTADATAGAINEVRALTTTNLIGALKFIAQNPADNDRQTEFVFHKISIKANGDLTLIGDDWSQASFQGAAEANATASPSSPTLTVRGLAA